MREFSFTLKDDVYIRYLSFADDHELEKEMQKRLPYKIDIGAVYNCKVRRMLDTSILMQILLVTRSGS